MKIFGHLFPPKHLGLRPYRAPSPVGFWRIAGALVLVAAGIVLVNWRPAAR